jgi:TRAP-type C4-dicarboxylate transport system substrate-binding protein
MRYLALLTLALLPLPLAGDGPVTLRFASVAPDGSPWARELKAVARNVEDTSNGQLKIHWYFNAVAGDESEMGQRLMQGQLDGMASGQFCERVAPSLRIMRLPGLFQDREEANDVASRLQPTIDTEAHQAGVVLPASVAMGPDLIFTNKPVHNMEELRRLKLWRWANDEVGNSASRDMGLTIVPLPIPDAARAFDNGQIDGFFAIPAAALAFQWSTRARYVIDLRGNTFVWGCIIIEGKSFGRLSLPHQALLREAAAKMAMLIDRDGRHIDEQLLGGLFQRQGLQVVKVSDSFRSDFFAAAARARDRSIDRMIPRALLDRAMQLLADHRAEYAGHQ